jgi:hypothetical protein
MRLAPSTLAVALLLAAGGNAAAHDFWAEPSTYTPKAGDEVAVRLRVGDHFTGEEFPRSERHCERFLLLGAEGAVAIPGKDQGRPAGRVLTEHAGLQWIVYRSRDSVTTVPPAIFPAYLEAEGLAQDLAEWRAVDPEGKRAVREAFSRCVKALVNVGGAPRPEAGGELRGGADPKAAGFDRVVGLKLEIVPEANPLALKPGEELPVRLQWEGKPLADRQVSALSARDPRHPVRARTDAAGRARLKLPHAGVWLVKSVHLERAGPDEPLDYRSTWSALTFEMPALPPPIDAAANSPAG